MSLRDARKTVEKWQEQRGTFTLVVPEDNEFMESFNPGIDIHIFPQHPFYHFHVKRVDSYQSFQRIYSLLALLFVEEDEYFIVSEKAEKVYERQGAAIEERILEGEKEGRLCCSDRRGRYDCAPCDGYSLCRAVLWRRGRGR